MSKVIQVLDKPKVECFVLCTCYAKEDYYCKNWNGKGNVPSITDAVKEICKNNNTDPDTCEFLVKPIQRKGCDWIWQTTCGSPSVTTEIVEEKGKVTVKEKKVKKATKLTCGDCDKDAVYKIEGYKPTYLCKDHAEIAKADGFEVIEIAEE